MLPVTGGDVSADAIKQQLKAHIAHGMPKYVALVGGPHAVPPHCEIGNFFGEATRHQLQCSISRRIVLRSPYDCRRESAVDSSARRNAAMRRMRIWMRTSSSMLPWGAL